MVMLVWRDLVHRRWRVLAVTLLMAIVLTLLFLLTGLVGQFNAEPRLATEQAGADRVWLLPEGTSGPFTSAQAVPEEMFLEIPGADPVLVGRANAADQQVVLIGRTSDGWNTPKLSDGRYPTAPGEVVADESLGASTGQQIDLNGEPITVVGVAKDSTVLAGIPLLFTSLPEAQARLASGEKVVIGALAQSVPEPLPPGLVTKTTDQVAADTLAPLEPAISSVTMTRVLLWTIASIIIAAVIYITALERTRDFAVLKAVGGRNSDLGLTLLIQGVVMALLATGIAAILQIFLAPLFPLPVRVPPAAWWQIPLIATIVSTVAAIGGIRKVSSTSPAEAFS